MSSDTLPCRICLARKPNTKSIASMTFDLPLPFGPTTEVMLESKGPIVTGPAYDLKLSSTMREIITRRAGAAPSNAASNSSPGAIV
eukprot:scaffold7006_cov108-Isochrysis_galbana.AAC.4